MPRLKILHLITSLERGGAQTMLTRLVLNLDRERFAPVVVSLLDDGFHAAELAASGIPVMGLGMRRGMPSPGGLMRLRRIVANERPALVQSWLYHADLLALFAGGTTPLAWNIRCSTMAGDDTLRLRAILRALAWASRRPAAVLVNSAAGQRFHAALGYHPRRWEVVPNGFDVELFRPDPRRRDEGRGRLGLGEAQTAIGMVARVDAMKDHATFLAAAVMVAAVRNDARFVLVGAGTEALPIPPALEGRVQALGEMGAVNELLPALDLAVLASIGEGFPNVLGEAMACGVPCLASDVGDCAAIVAETGSVVPPGDARALADAMLAFIARGPAERAQLGRLARARVIAEYSIAAAARRYAAIYVTLAAKEAKR
jgi:glycosyltransferase involved in cell wall biosynthesis